MADDPPYLSVGTAVSAKYKGAFCEAKVSKVVRVVKCKVTFKMGLGTATVSDDQIKGPLRVGSVVQVKHPEKKEFVEATIAKIQDCSQYTVVFDDGDITTLRRTALCLKSGRHFNESETLDQLPLTHPEHFGNPVVGGRRGRRNRQFKEDSSEGEAEEENEPDLQGYSTDIGRVVSVEATDKKRGKDNWFPGLVVIPSAQPTVRINVKDEFLIRSFKDGRYYTVPKKEISEFSREIGEKVESSVLAEAVNKALKYLDNNELPVHWERNSLFNMQSIDSDSDGNYSDSSDDEPNEEKDRFVAQLYKFMDDSGTPLNKSPMIGNKDVDLHKLFRVVHKLGGYNRVTNNNKWRLVTTRLKLPNNQVTYNQVKNVYKKCLLSYESFYKTLGVTMLNHNMSSKKNRGRSLIRDKDRATPVNSPRPDKEEDSLEKKDDEKSLPDEKTKKKPEVKKDDEKKRKDLVENSDTNSSDATDQSESAPGTSKDAGRPRRLDRSKEKKVRAIIGVDKAKPESTKKEEEEKIQQTRSKSQIVKPKEMVTVSTPKKEVKAETPKVAQKQPAKKSEDDKKRGRKKLPDEKPSVEIVTDSASGQSISVGDKLKVYYGPTHEYKVTYEAKVLEIERESTGPVYLVHYTGWNTRYDEWIAPSRIAENLSANNKARRLKQGTSATTPSTKQASSSKTPAAKRGRGTSVTSKSATTATTTSPEVPRSTTPSSVTSSSSRTKSPATPATRSSSRMTRLDYGRKTRRASAQTDISNHSESESEISESEPELTRTRSGTKSEEIEIKTYKKKVSRTPTVIKSEKKDEMDTEKEEESERPKRARKLKKSPEKSGEESEDDNGSSLPKGRDFDLNQIRSELKGFNKAVKVPSLDTAEKEVSSSSEDSNTQVVTKTEPVEEKKEVKPVETFPTSDDIYEFKEPEPFEFESRAKMVDEKVLKKRIPRLYEDLEKSPKKKILKSPGKSDKDSPELEKKRFRRTPVRKQEESEDEDKKEEEDPFDKLVESPSYNVKPLEKTPENKPKVIRSTTEEALNIFRDSVDDYARDIDLSDNESQGRHLFTRDDELFSGTFTKYSPDRNLDLEFSSKVEEAKKESDDLESIRESITRAIERTPSSDECDNLSDDEDDLVITTSPATYQGKKRDVEVAPVVTEAIKSEPVPQETVEVKEEIKEEIVQKSPVSQISPALQETDSSLLESICAQPLSITTKLEDTKDLNLKTGTRIADSLLQKFSSMKSKSDVSPKRDSDNEQDKKEIDDASASDGAKLIDVSRMIKQVELKVKPSEIEVKKTAIKGEPPSPEKKRRKVVSRPYIEESDSNSSDSEQLVIARSDEDSQTNSLDKPDIKESDSNLSLAQIGSTDDSQSQEEQRNFKFDTIDKSLSPEPVKEEQPEPESVKEDEPDSQLHSLLLCEETIPRSPAPASEGSSVVEQRPKTKSVLEMPFASAPGNCNNKNMLLNNEHKPAVKPQSSAVAIPLGNRERDVSTVITPPSTPGSSTSGDNGDLSPNTIENESCKSNDAELDYPRKRRNSSLNKAMYSEEDTQMTNEPGVCKKMREESVPASCRKRRKSARASDDVPTKRGRKPLNRSRHNSDSDDTSEHSLTGPAPSLGLPSYDRASKSPRPSKYNFFVEFDPSLNSGQRIAVLQQKLTELRKTYAEVKAELAAVERRRKKIRRREREALKASKQEMVCG